jgi:glycosyltransferase involved in cell wall biosynthesis
MSNTTMIFLNWKRSNNLNYIIDRSLDQTIVPKIIVIDNSSKDPSNKIESRESFEYIPSDNSLQCWSRWSILDKVTTDYVCVMDDDLAFTQTDVLSICEKYMDENPEVNAVGYAGVIGNSTDSYWSSIHHHTPLEKNINVRIIKGRFMFIRKKSLEGLDQTPDFTCDDIKVCSHLKNKVLLSDLRNKFMNLQEGMEAVHRQPQQHQRREKAVQKYFGK